MCSHAVTGLRNPEPLVAVSADDSDHFPEVNLSINTGARQTHLGRRGLSSTRLKVAVDVDEVLAQFVDSLNRYYFNRFGTQYQVSDYFEYCYRKIWNCSQDESADIVHAFFDSQFFLEDLRPLPGAFDALSCLSDYVDLEVVTARQNVIKDHTLDWLDTHFPGVFSAVHFGNHWAKEGKSLPKSQICKNIGAACIIDDNPGYAVECAEAGIDVLLFDWNLGYPWSKTPDGPSHEKILRVGDWDDVTRAVLTLAKRT
uniref:Haloacid dehalogenase-like hydrolase superfamily protein n=1 Tax=Tetraselmis sp. GSL018 TaxID=582737 RepID=A0A061R900_9CHLO